MSRKSDKPIPGRGGAVTVGEGGSVEHAEGTVNPDDPGYRERIAREPVHDGNIPGTLNRAPSFRDTVQAAERAERAKLEKSKGSAAPASPTKPTGGK